MRSKFPQQPSESGQPIPGKYLLDHRSVRTGQLTSRIKTTGIRQQQGIASPSLPSVLPGIQFRPTLGAGDLANSIVAGDFNGDGTKDFVVANGGTDDLWMYLGNGDGTFQLPRIIPLTKGLTPVYVAAADLRGNGTLDLVVAEYDSSTVAVLLGNGDGTFSFEKQYVLPEPPAALAIDDFNRDGKLDVVAVMDTEYQPQGPGVEYIATLLGDGTGSFAAPLITKNPGIYSSAESIVSGDVNHDGLPDVLITGPGNENAQIYLNAGDGTFTPGAIVIRNIDPFVVLLAGALADVNGDGCLDALAADVTGYVQISLGDCSGDFAAPSMVPMGDSISSIAVADMNGDGHLDLVSTSIPALLDQSLGGPVGGNSVAVSFGDGKGNFTPGRVYVTTGMSYSVAIADFNGDGHPDAISASPDTGTVSVLINDGSGGFGFPQGEWVGARPGGINDVESSPSFVDLNGDGKPDMVLVDGGDSGEYLITAMLNDGTGRFSAPIISDAGISVLSDWMGDFRLGDFRNTGHPDFVGIGLNLTYSGGTQYIFFAPGNGDGTFGKSSLVAMTGADGAMTTGDFNRDGKLDIAAVGNNPNNLNDSGWLLSTFLGNGDGTFRPGGSVPFTDSANEINRVFVGDFNRDGILDILVYDTANTANQDGTFNSYVWEFLGNGDGTFQSGQQLFSPFQPLTLADVNGDSFPDIVRYDLAWPTATTQTAAPARFTTYLGQPPGTFAQSSSYAPYDGIPAEFPPVIQFGDPAASSWIADLNGDGKPDEVAVQRSPQPLSEDHYAQILVGNGDGTFTPTYDVFDFVNGYPAYAHFLDGSNVADLVEIDDVANALRVFKGAPAPALQMSLEEDQVNGTNGCGWVFLNVPSGSDTNVALSSSVPGVVLPNVTVPAGSLSQQFCYTLSSTYDWRQVFDIRAQLGSDSAVAFASQSYSVGFSESIDPGADQVIYAGQATAPVTVTLTSNQGYSSTVSLSCAGLQTGESCTFSPDTLNVSPTQPVSTTLVVNTSATTSTQGFAPVTVVASDANVTHRQSFKVAVTTLVVSGSASVVPAISPGSGTAEIYINHGFPPYQLSCSGLPAGAICSFSGTQVAYPNQTALIMSLNVPSGLTPQNYPFTVTVTSGQTSASMPLTLAVEDFALQPPVSGSAWGLPGSTSTVNLTAQALSGTVNLTCTVDAGTCTAAPASLTPSGGQVKLTVSEPANASVGAKTLTVTATYGTLTHSIAFPFYVADYSGTLSSSALTIARGGTGGVSATVQATTAFSGNVSFACSGPAQVTCNFSPATVQLTGANSQTTNITVVASNVAAVPAGTTRRIFAFAFLFPFGLVLGVASTNRSRIIATAVLVSVLVLASVSCGGGGGSTVTNTGGGSTSTSGGGGSATYTVTVTANLVGAPASRTLGTVTVTVTH
ncbi:MAG: FG-GAP-like repeat-containing protein [Terriglobales bacterium]